MSAIHEFKCDSCKTTAKAHWNGDTYLFPIGWVEMFCRDVHSKGHLCEVCVGVIWQQNLRLTKVGKDQAKKVGL